MAAEGAWSRRRRSQSDDARTRRAVDQVRGVLGDLEGRLSAPAAVPLPPEAATALGEALQTLSRRMARHEEVTAETCEALGSSLRALARRLDLYSEQQAALAAKVAEGETRIAVRLEQALAEIAAARAASGARVGRGRIVGPLMAVSAMGAMVVGVAMLAREWGPPTVVPSSAMARGSLPLRLSLPLRPSLGIASAALESPPPAPLPVAPIAPPAVGVRDAYPAVTAALERGDATALPRLVGLAQAGDARAQLHLASLYEGGAPGVPRDLAAARSWTRRAAEGGDRVAMYNLALFLIDAGGTDAEAANWFRRAAERGVVDAQYNLGLLHEAGRGVDRNLREAYRWFSVAANAGDAAAREKQVELEGRLQPAERSGLDHDAAGFQPNTPAAADLATLIPPAETLAATQALLARKGYYVGPIDGVATPALRTAAAAYLRDHPKVMP